MVTFSFKVDMRKARGKLIKDLKQTDPNTLVKGEFRVEGICSTCKADKPTVKLAHIADCFKCGNAYHSDCLTLPLSEAFLQQMSTDPSIWWFCPSCVVSTKAETTVDQAVPDQVNLMDSISDKMSDLKTELMNTMSASIDSKFDLIMSKIEHKPDQSYAAAAACEHTVPSHPPPVVVPVNMAPSPPTPLDVVVLSPQTDNTSEVPWSTVAKRVKNKLKNVDVAFTAGNDNSKTISLGFPDTQSRDKGIAAINEDNFLSSIGYESKNATKMLPKITVHNVRNDVFDVLNDTDLKDYDTNQLRELKKKTLKDIILSKNTGIQPLVDTGHTFEVIYLNESKFGSKKLTIGIKVSPAIRKAILEKQRGCIYIEGQSYKISDRFHVKDCYHCQHLGHISTDCPNKLNAPTCMFCSKAHRTSDCRVKQDYSAHCCVKCLNSKVSIEQVNYRTHNSGSPFCPVVERERQRLAAMTDMTSKNVL